MPSITTIYVCILLLNVIFILTYFAEMSFQLIRTIHMSYKVQLFVFKCIIYFFVII